MKLLLALTLIASSASAQVFTGSAALDAATGQAIRDGLIPGAVILIGHDGKIVYRKAYGARALVPAREAATLDTIYDVASLTKVVATTPAIMKLYEQGKIKLDDPVTTYLPEFQGGKSNITIRNLTDALLRTASRSRYRSGLERVRHGHPQSAHRQARRAARSKTSSTVTLISSC